MTLHAWVALIIFLSVIAVSASGLLKTATASLIGASLMAAVGIVSPEEAVAAIDHNTIGLLTGMMIVVGVLSKSGLFQFLAVRSIKITGGRPMLIFWIVSLLTAVLSAFLDNVTTVLLVTPVVLSLCELIALDPLPFIIIELFASNIGGTATLIGDPPNMIVSSVAGFSFNDFLVTAAPVAILVLCAVTAYTGMYYKDRMKFNADAAKQLADVDERKLIVNKPLMIKSVVVMVCVLIGFTAHSIVHIEPSVVALAAAGILLALSLLDEKSIIHDDVEWPTLIYFISLFIMAGGLKAAGVITSAADVLVSLMAGRPIVMILGTLWVSGLVCTVINNIAFTAIFVQIIASMAQEAGIDAAPLYWALAFGACLGGNGTYFGAAANAVVVDFAAKEGMHITFASFTKAGMKTVFISLLIASAAILFISRSVWM